MTYYLGLDSSTQSLSAMIIDVEASQVVVDVSINFGRELSEFGSPNGFLPNPDPQVKHSDPLMWVAALDLLLDRIKTSGFDLGKVRAISGAGQQHGSVYLKKPIADASAWNPAQSLAEQVAPLLSRKTAPIWMDSSTSEECREIAGAVGGDAEVTRLTGSRAIERFTGPQIRKFFKQDKSSYENTAEIHMVSSFMASLLAHRTAPIDLGDGAGMNLLELATGKYHPKLLEATAPNLGEKLPAPAPASTPVGPIDPYFVKKYGFSAETTVYAFTGDNPSSLVGMGASKPGTAVISLGTSDTVFAAMDQPRTDPRGYGHVFGNPAGGFMSLICFTNGSLAREEVKNKLNVSWDDFANFILNKSDPGNAGNFFLPYFVPETTPKLLNPQVRLFGSEAFKNWKDPAAAARGIVESQAISMRHHADWIGPSPDVLLVTGGASQNRGVLQILADVFQAELKTLSTGNSSALGAALRAAQASGNHSFDQLSSEFAAPDPGRVITPSERARPMYNELLERFKTELDNLLSERAT